MFYYSITYDGARKLATTRKMRKETKSESDNGRFFSYASVPYNIDFSLYIMTKYSEDATQLMEQIIPFFTPDWTVTAKMIPDLESVDIPIVLNSVTNEEIYEGDYTERVTVLYTLSFTMKAWYFGPERNKKIIKFIDLQYATDTDANAEFEENTEIFPVIVANTGIGWADVEFDDDWIANTQFNSPYGVANPWKTDVIPGDDPYDLSSNTINDPGIDLTGDYGLEDLN